MKRSMSTRRKPLGHESLESRSMMAADVVFGAPMAETEPFPSAASDAGDGSDQICIVPVRPNVWHRLNPGGAVPDLGSNDQICIVPGPLSVGLPLDPGGALPGVGSGDQSGVGSSDQIENVPPNVLFPPNPGGSLSGGGSDDEIGIVAGPRSIGHPLNPGGALSDGGQPNLVHHRLFANLARVRHGATGVTATTVAAANQTGDSRHDGQGKRQQAAPAAHQRLAPTGHFATALAHRPSRFSVRIGH